MLEILSSGIIKFKIESQTVWDMRRAGRNRYSRDEVKPNDIVVYSEKKFYLISKDGSYRNINKTDRGKVILFLREFDRKISNHLKSKTTENAG